MTNDKQSYEKAQRAVKKADKMLKKEKENVIETSFFETDKFIYEEIVTESTEGTGSHTEGTATFSFLRYEKKTENVDVVDSFTYHDKNYKPLVDDALLKGGVILPTGVSEYGKPSKLTKDMKDFIDIYVEFPGLFGQFMPNLALFYWLYDKFPFVPYVHFIGRTTTGKTTAMEVFGSLCYKPIDTTGSVTEASMFRLATSWKGTMLIDEFDAIAGNRSMISFLKAGVSNRLLYRAEGETVKKVQAYIVKSPKLFTSENPISDAGLQSRTILVEMEEATRELPLFRLRKYFTESNELRNKLLLWRLRNLNKINLEKIEYGFDELKSKDKRVQQVITPVYYLADKETKVNLLTFAKEQEEETLIRRRESLHGQIFETINSIWAGEVTDNRWKKAEIPEDEISKLEKGVQIKALTRLLNSERKLGGYKYELTSERVSSVIRNVLKFKTETLGFSKLAWVIEDESKRLKLIKYYGLEETNKNKKEETTGTNDESVPSLPPSVPSVPPVKKLKRTKKVPQKEVIAGDNKPKQSPAEIFDGLVEKEEKIKCLK